MDLTKLQKDKLYVVVAIMPEAIETLPPGSIHIALKCAAGEKMTALDVAVDAIEHVADAMRFGIELAKADVSLHSGDNGQETAGEQT